VVVLTTWRNSTASTTFPPGSDRICGERSLDGRRRRASYSGLASGRTIAGEIESIRPLSEIRDGRGIDERWQRGKGEASRLQDVSRRRLHGGCFSDRSEFAEHTARIAIDLTGTGEPGEPPRQVAGGD
jgi:hypothetical protein